MTSRRRLLPVPISQAEQETSIEEVAFVSSKERYRIEKLRSALAANELPFDRVGLCGRERERKILKERYVSLLKGDTNNEILVLAGFSGTGKTALATSIKNAVESDMGVFCTGKYDTNLRDQPLVGISELFQQLCQNILVSKKLKVIEDTLREELDDLQIHLLGQVASEVFSIMKVASSFRHYTLGTANVVDKTKAQLEAAILTFLRIVTASIHPLVVLLDDIQWADALSIDLFEKISTGDLRWMLILSYRSNEMDDSHPYFRSLENIRNQQKRNKGLVITELELGDLSLSDLEIMISELLSADRGEVQKLAAVCYNRTHGNAFFVINFLSMLVDEGFLQFDLGSYKWNFNVQTIELETEATQNLVDVIQQKIKRQSEEMIHLALVASCLGNSFNPDILRLVRDRCPNRILKRTKSELEFEALLEHATSELLFENISLPKGFSQEPKLGPRAHRRSSQRIRFVHDKIQESFMDFIPRNEFESLQDEVAMTLVNNLSSDELEEMLFVVVNLLNNGGRSSIGIAKLNLRAAVKANEISSFATVAKFVKAGLRNIPEADAWALHFDMMLQLHHLGAFAEQNLGNPEVAEEYCDQVLARSNATPEQRCPAFHIKSLIWHNRGQDKVLELCLECLSELGCDFPDKAFRSITAPFYLKQTISQFVPAESEIEKMPMMTEPTKIAAMELLEEAGSLAFLTQNGPLYIMLRCRFVRWVKKYGLTKSCASAFASLGNVLMHKYNMYDKSVELARLSISTQRILNTRSASAKFYEARTLCTATYCVLAWRYPLQTRLKTLIQGYVSGMKSGNVFSACTCILYYIWASLQSGTKLTLLREDCRNFISQLNRLQNIASDIVTPIWQLCENLLSEDAENPSLLSGSIMTEDEYKKSIRVPSLSTFHVIKALGCMYFGEYERGADLALTYGHDELRRDFPGTGFGSEYLPYGVCLYATAQKTKQRKLKRMANTVRAELGALVKTGGCINLAHHLNILDAEFYAINGKSDKATQSYREATIAAARGGFLQDAAVAYERWAHLLVHQGEDKISAKHHLEEAMRYYTEWGATRKVALLREQHQALLNV